jgi:hypothetical protein
MSQGRSWEQRLFVGLQWPGMDGPQLALARALGEIGVEAEFFLLLTGSETALSVANRAAADSFLQQLEVSCRRICAAAASLEVATQGYLAALDTRFPQARLAHSPSGPWWPSFAGYTASGEPLELRLRRCGYSYRHAVEAHLTSNIDAISEQLALTLHALQSLPPAGVAPVGALYHGLDELSSALQGHVTPNHIAETAAESPGVLAGVRVLRVLDQEQDHSIQADISWVQEQLGLARETLAQLGVKRSPMSALVRLGLRKAPPTAPDTAAWVARSIREWEDALKQLTAIAREQQAVRR